MSPWFVIFAMVFCHVLDDFCLQPIILSKLKQKSFWEKNAPEKLYQYDYIAALIIHAFSWSFMILLPIAIAKGFVLGLSYVITLIVNSVIHAIVDDVKANRHKINLIEDQSIHVIQIVITFIMFLGGIL